MNNYTGLGREYLEANNLFLKLLSVKMDILNISLSFCADSLYLDSDVFLLNPIYIDSSNQIILSHANIKKELQDDVGIYNAGYIWSSSRHFVNTWKHNLQNSRYFDQHILQEICTSYKYSTFDESHNIMPWRLMTPVESQSNFINSLSNAENRILINNKDVTSIHTHLFRKDFRQFNKMILHLLYLAGHEHGLQIVNQIIVNRL